VHVQPVCVHHDTQKRAQRFNSKSHWVKTTEVDAPRLGTGKQRERVERFACLHVHALPHGVRKAAPGDLDSPVYSVYIYTPPYRLFVAAEQGDTACTYSLNFMCVRRAMGYGRWTMGEWHGSEETHANPTADGVAPPLGAAGWIAENTRAITLANSRRPYPRQFISTSFAVHAKQGGGEIHTQTARVLSNLRHVAAYGPEIGVERIGEEDGLELLLLLVLRRAPALLIALALRHGCCKFSMSALLLGPEARLPRPRFCTIGQGGGGYRAEEVCLAGKRLKKQHSRRLRPRSAAWL